MKVSFVTFRLTFVTFWLTFATSLQPNILTVIITSVKPIFHWSDHSVTHQQTSEFVHTLTEDNLWTFYDVYSSTQSLIVYIDLRYEACPVNVFPRQLLAYITVSTKICPEVDEAIDYAVVRVPNDHLDSMFIAADFFNSRTTMLNSTVSFALLFDKSGEEFMYLANQQNDSHVVHQISIPLVNCSCSQTVTSLAANTNIGNILVIATSECIMSLFTAFSQLDLPDSRFRWLIYPTNTDQMKYFCGQFTDVCDHIQPVLLTSKHIQVTFDSQRDRLVSLKNNAIKLFLSNFDVNNTNKQLNTSLSQGNQDNNQFSQNYSYFCKSCQNLFKLSAEMSMQEDTTPEQEDIYELYSMTSLGNVLLGNWSKISGLTLDQQAFRTEFIDSHLTVAVIVEQPFIFRNTSAPGSYYGYSMDVLTEIARSVGFTFTIRECHDGEYGSLENGVWNGCIGNVLRGEADVILGTLTVTAERDNVIDFTLPYYDFAGIQILTRKQTSNINLFYYIDVFSTQQLLYQQAWLCLIAVVLLTSLLLWFFERMTCTGSPTQQVSEENNISQKVFHHTNGLDTVQYVRHALAYNNTTFIADRQVHVDTEQRKGYSVPRRGLGDNIWFVIGAVTMAGGGDPPKTVAGRVLVSGFWFFAIIIMSTFTANLAAFLTVSRMGATISNLEDLMGQNDMKYSVINRSSVMDYFKRMARIERNFYERWKNMTLDKSDSSNQDSLAVWEYPLGKKYDTIWTTIQDTGLVKTIEQGIDKVLNENFALITESPLIQYYTGQNCLLSAVGDQFSVRPYAIGLKENSPYTARFSQAILKLQRDRELGSLRLKWWSSNDVTCDKDTGNTGLDLYSLSGTFFIAGVGVLGGILILFLECIIAYIGRVSKS